MLLELLVAEGVAEPVALPVPVPEGLGEAVMLLLLEMLAVLEGEAPKVREAEGL